MPLRDHFRAPVDELVPWEAIHGGWPMVLATTLMKRLPADFIAFPRVHLGSEIEVDVATFDGGENGERGLSSGGGQATALWSPPQATLQIEVDFPSQDEYEVRIYDQRRSRRLVAAVELVSPANKDRAEHRRTFVAKCAALLQEDVSVCIVDVVTTRGANLYSELLEFVGSSDPCVEPSTPAIYAAACRGHRGEHKWLIRNWYHPLEIGQPLPTLPLWLTDDFAVPLELEASYEETCGVFRLK